MIIVTGNKSLNLNISAGSELTPIQRLSETKAPCNQLWLSRLRIHKPEYLLLVPENEVELMAMKRDIYLKHLICESLEEARQRLIEPAKAAMKVSQLKAAAANTTAQSQNDMTRRVAELTKQNAELQATIQHICTKFNIVRSGAGWRPVIRKAEKEKTEE